MILTTAYEWLLVVHILAAMVWLGGLVTATTLAALTARAADARAMDGFVPTLRRAAPFLFGPPAAAVVAMGVLMVLDSDAWSFGQGWITVAFVALIASAALGASVARRSLDACADALQTGDAGAAAAALRRWTVTVGLITCLLVVATVDMVVKPGL